MNTEKKFLKILDILQEIADDRRIPIEIRGEYMDMVSDILEEKTESQ